MCFCLLIVKYSQCARGHACQQAHVLRESVPAPAATHPCLRVLGEGGGGEGGREEEEERDLL